MNVLHSLDSWNIGGIQEYALLVKQHSVHRHDVMGGSGTMTPYLREENMITWSHGPPPSEAHYDVVIGHTVGGWSHDNLFSWAKKRGMKTIETMHSNAKSPTSPTLVDAFIGMNSITTALNTQYDDRHTIYGVCSEFAEERRGNLIGRMSRLAEEKRPRDFVAIARQMPDLSFVMAGEGAEYIWCMENRSDNLWIAGTVRNFPAFFRLLCLFVFPTKDECCCMSVAMAQMAGVPVVCQDIPPLRETTGGHALFAVDVADFCKKIRYAIGAPDQVAGMAKDAQDWARSKFSPENTVGRIDALVSRLCGAA